MTRYIDADAVIEFIENRYDITWEDDYEGGIKDACVDILEKIKNTPTADVVEVVRCKDCRQKSVYIDDKRPYCIRWEKYTIDDAYCSWGERKSE